MPINMRCFDCVHFEADYHYRCKNKSLKKNTADRNEIVDETLRVCRKIKGFKKREER